MLLDMKHGRIHLLTVFTKDLGSPLSFKFVMHLTNYKKPSLQKVGFVSHHYRSSRKMLVQPLEFHTYFRNASKLHQAHVHNRAAFICATMPWPADGGQTQVVLGHHVAHLHLVDGGCRPHSAVPSFAVFLFVHHMDDPDRMAFSHPC